VCPTVSTRAILTFLQGLTVNVLSVCGGHVQVDQLDHVRRRQGGDRALVQDEPGRSCVGRACVGRPRGALGACPPEHESVRRAVHDVLQLGQWWPEPEWYVMSSLIISQWIADAWFRLLCPGEACHEMAVRIYTVLTRFAAPLPTRAA
jgi:hypothetical protein